MWFRHKFVVWAAEHGDLSFVDCVDLLHSCGVHVLVSLDNTLEEHTSGVVVLVVEASLQEVVAVQNSAGEIVARLAALWLVVLADETVARLVALVLAVLAGEIVARLTELDLVVLAGDGG